MGVSSQVMDVVEGLDRMGFLPGPVQGDLDNPQHIGFGQTMSASWIAAWQAALLDIKQGEKILEIGGGCGYLATILSRLGATVHAVEIIPFLAQQAFFKVDPGVRVWQGNGFLGIPQEAPFDGIVISCMVPHEGCLMALIPQLKTGSRIIYPRSLYENNGLMMKASLRPDGEMAVRPVRGPGVAFVPVMGLLTALFPQRVGEKSSAGR